MKIGLSLRHSGEPAQLAGLARRAEEIGVDSVWVQEAYGSDAVSVLGNLAGATIRIGLGAAVLQMPARTPAATAMAAMTLDHLCAGRLSLGLGTSGPQVAQGWHGVPFDSPLGRTREYVDIVRRVVARQEPLSLRGRHYPLPLPGPDGRPSAPALRSSLRPLRPRIPVLLASNGPRNVALTAEIADGWLPAFFAPGHRHVYDKLLAPGLARRAPELGPLRIVATVHVAAGPDLDACRDALRPAFALYIGGMGGRGRNFYTDLVARLGYERDASRIQDLYLDGHRAEAAAAVPDALLDELALVGPPARIRDRLDAWRSAGVDVLTLKTTDIALVRTLIESL